MQGKAGPLGEDEARLVFSRQLGSRLLSRASRTRWKKDRTGWLSFQGTHSVAARRAEGTLGFFHFTRCCHSRGNLQEVTQLTKGPPSEAEVLFPPGQGLPELPAVSHWLPSDTWRGVIL